MDAGVLNDPSEGNAVFTGPNHAHDALAELTRVGSSRGAHPSWPSNGQARLDVTHLGGSPDAFTQECCWLALQCVCTTGPFTTCHGRQRLYGETKFNHIAVGHDVRSEERRVGKQAETR